MTDTKSTTDQTRVEERIGPYLVATRDVADTVALEITSHSGRFLLERTTVLYLNAVQLDELIACLQRKRRAMPEQTWAQRQAARVAELGAICDRVRAKWSAPIEPIRSATTRQVVVGFRFRNGMEVQR